MWDINLVSNTWVLSFLMIVMFGYIFVEVIFWEKYFFRSSLERYNFSWINRIIHYIFWWTLTNLILFILYRSWHLIESFVSIIGYNWPNSMILSYFLWAIVVFSFSYIIVSLFNIVVTDINKSDFIKKRKKKTEPKKKLKLKIKSEIWE